MSLKKVKANKRTIVITFKVNAEEMRKMLAMSMIKTSGNMSLLIRQSLGLK